MKRITKSFVAIAATLAITMSVVLTEYAHNSNIKALRDNNIEALSSDGEGAYVEIFECVTVDNGTNDNNPLGPNYVSMPGCIFEYWMSGWQITQNGQTYYPCGEPKTVRANCTSDGCCWEMGIVENRY